MSTVTVIIVNWNGRHWLERCLPALQAQTYADFQVIVVDNGSTDGSVSWLDENWPAVRVLPNDRNLGFAAANNAAISASRGEYVVTLNNDVLVEPGWLSELVAGAADPDIGMVASQIALWDRPDMLDSAGLEVDRAGIGWNRGWGQAAATARTACDVFGACAAAGLYRRAMLDEIGLFDEDFFAYYEDVDLAWRAQRAGWRGRYAPAARVLHWHSATGRQSIERKLFLLGRNKVWTILKNYDWPDLAWAWPLIGFYDGLAIAFQTLRTRSWAALHGRLSALPAARRMIAKRGRARRRVPLAAPRSLSQIAADLRVRLPGGQAQDVL